MRILCLIMVGAFLLTIAIAENGDSQRVNDKPQASMVPARILPQSMNIPRLLHRASDSGPAFNPSTNYAIPDSMASPAIAASQYLHREHNSATTTEGSMILEPMHKHRSTPSWMDWIPDFLDEDPPPGPGPLIGPIDFPGLSRNLYIRQHEPLDDDTNHVVIHVINRQKPSYSPASVGLAQLPLGNNQISYYNKKPSQYSGSFYTNPVKTQGIEFETALFPYKLVDENPWKLQTHTSGVKEIKDKKSQYPYFDAPTEISGVKPRLSSFSKTSKPVAYPQPGISWSQRFDGEPIVIEGRGQQTYGSSVESKAPVMFPAPNTTIASIKREQQAYSWHRKYGYQNSTKAASENVRTATANLRAKLAEISAANRRQVNHINKAPTRVSRTSEVSSRQPRNRFSHFDKINDTERSTISEPQKSSVPELKLAGLDFVTREVFPRQARNHISHFDEIKEMQRPVYIHKPSATEIKGALEVVQAPTLNNNTDGSTVKKSDDVMQNIMTMTASHQWKNITSNIIEAEKTLTKPIEAERRVDIMIDDEDETKEMTTPTTTTTATTTTTTTTTTRPPVPATNQTDKAKINMKEAVEKMMSSFTQWRYKVVDTNFLKELDDKEASERKKDR